MGYRALGTRGVLAAASIVLMGCGDEPLAPGVQEADTHALDFDRHLVLPDEALTDPQAMTLAEVQAFLEETPHGNRSVLADHLSHGRTAAEAIVDAATEQGISPLILLARLQLEQSLVGKQTASSSALKWAMGCGCPDGGGCASIYAGFDRQVKCAAERFATYLAQLQSDGATVAGWAVGESKSSLEGTTVRPRNHHTAALYTYTPWVSSAKQYLGLYRQYAAHVDYAAPAPGGCPTATFPSGTRVQLRPDPSLAESLGSTDPCFFDAQVLVDHETFVAHGPSTKLSDDFTVYELTDAATRERFRLAPSLIAGLQDTRDLLGQAIHVEVGWRHPDDLASSCDSVTDPICASGELSAGTAAIVTSPAGDSAVMNAAAAAGVPTCRMGDQGVYLAVGEPPLGCSP